MSVKDRSKSNVTAWIELRLRALKLVVANEPVDYHLFDLIDNIMLEIIQVIFLRVDVIISYKDPDILLTRLLTSETNLLGLTEELEALIKKLEGD